MSDMKIVTFKKEWRGYAIGETAGFDPAAADALIESGRARLYVEKVTPEKSAKPPAAKASAAKKPAVTAKNAEAEVQSQQQEQEQQEQQQEQEQQEQQQEQEQLEQLEQQENEDLDEKP